jgi:hypothetical protein
MHLARQLAERLAWAVEDAARTPARADAERFERAAAGAPG